MSWVVVDVLKYLIYAGMACSALYIFFRMGRAVHLWYTGGETEVIETTQDHQQVVVNIHVPSTPQSVPHARLDPPTVAATAPPLSPQHFAHPYALYEGIATANDAALARELQQQEIDRAAQQRHY
jgi:hypothetical protein